VLGSQGGIIAVQSQGSGEVRKVLVGAGKKIEPDTPVLELASADGETSEVTAGYSGEVLEVLVAEGRVVDPGSDLFTLAGEPGGRPDRAYLFLPPSDASGVAPGMDVDLNVSSAPQEAFGSAAGKVESVSGAPVSPQQVDVLVANDTLVGEFTASGAPILITVMLEPAETATGIEWTGGPGPQFPLTPGTIVGAEIRQGEQSVLDVVLGDR
jgi:HlyD family secretion protein